MLSATLDKSIYVLKRAIVVAAPAAALTWLLANIFIGDTSLLMYFVNFLDPFAKMLGLDRFILAAFILGLPANEIVIPILLMSYLSTGALTEIDDFNQIKKSIPRKWLDLVNSVKHNVVLTSSFPVRNNTG